MEYVGELMPNFLKTVCLAFFSLISFGMVSAPRLLIKIPTCSRPEKFFNRLDIYYRRLSSEIPVTFLISCDLEDQSMNNEQVIERLKSYPNLQVQFGHKCSKIEAYNRDIQDFDFDVLLLASDDMEPTVDGYDKIIADRMQKEFPAFDGVLNFSDGHIWAALNTVPVIGKKYYDAFGYAYYPEYVAFHCDNELTAVSRILRRECVCDEIIFDHKHPIWTHEGWDELYERYQKQFFKRDEAIFETRRINYYGLSEEALRAVCPKDLSILISVSDECVKQARQLRAKLQYQVIGNNLQDKVEILYFDTAVGATPGYRKNKLLWASNGYYITLLDENSRIDDNFVSTVYSMLAQKPDIILLKHGANISDCCEIIKRAIAVQFVINRTSSDQNKWRESMDRSGLLRNQMFADISKPR